MQSFAIVNGQDDNIGDVVLRRRLLDGLRALGPVHAFVGGASAGFVEGLDLAGHAVYRSFPAWYRAAVASAGRSEPSLLVHNAGELNDGWPVFKRQTALTVPTLLGRVRHGRTVRIGAGIRVADGPWLRRIKPFVRLADTTAWRDAASRDFFDVGTVRPDWAFDAHLPGIAPAADAVRDVLAVSLRYDRPVPDPAWFAGVAQAATVLGLRPVVVNQVRRDAPVLRALADGLAAETLDWPDSTSHLEQERRVRELYGRAALVVSDRLHVLVMGITEGALPAGFFQHSDIKIARNLGAAGMTGVSGDVTGQDGTAITAAITAVPARREALLAAAEQAAAEVRASDALWV